MAGAYNLSAPAIAAPDGVTPDFKNPPNQNTVAWGLFTLPMVVSTACVVLRGWAKWLNQRVRVEDWMIMGAYANYWGCAYASYALILQPGFFVHTWNLTLGDTIKPYYYIYIYGVFYSIVLALVKIAILVDWCRLFVPGNRLRSGFWWGSAVVVSVQGAFGVAAIFLLNFQCTPHAAIWDFTIPDARCIPLNALQLLSNSIHIASDVAILLLPQRTIWSLNMSTKRRVGVAIVFGLGALAVVSSVFRLIATIKFGQTQDKMYYICALFLWATAEMTCGFFVACMPCLPKIVKNSPLLRRLVGQSTRSTSTTACAGASLAGIGENLRTIGGTQYNTHHHHNNKLRSSMSGAAKYRSEQAYYREIDDNDEDGVHGGGGVSSTTQAENAHTRGASQSITKTTHVTVESEQFGSSGSASTRSLSDLRQEAAKTTWAKTWG